MRLSKLLLRLFAVLFTLQLAACGSSPSLSSQSSLSGSSPEKLLLVVMGGNNSCKPDATGNRSPLGMDMYPSFAALLRSLTADQEHARDIAYYLSCHNSDAGVQYVTSDAPNTMYRGDIAGVAPMLTTMTGLHQPDRIMIAGHSYGGWLAMKVGLDLPEDVAIDGLFTIDAISRVNCSPLHPSGCVSAPSDITTNQRNFLAARTDAWHNFFQTRTAYLHSSAISSADTNTQVNQPHTGIDTDAAVWGDIRTAITGNML